MLDIVIAIDLKEVRNTFQVALKELGCKTVAFESVGEAIKFITEEEMSPDIFISTPRTGEESVLDVLTWLIQNKNQRKTKVALLYPKDHAWIIPVAFELGLTSAHEIPMNKAQILNALRILIDCIEKNKKTPYLTAYSYFKKYLHDNEHFEELSDLIESLIKLKPDYPQFYIDLAESLFLAGKPEEAKETIKLSRFQDHTLQVSAQQLEDLINEEVEKSAPPPEKKIKKCVIIDPDKASGNQISKIVSRLGLPQRATFENADSCLEALTSNYNGTFLIIMEWKFPDATGIQLVQRIRSIKSIQPVIVVASSLVKKEDIILLKEMGVTSVVPKPFRNESFVATLISVIMKDRVPDSSETICVKFRRAALAGDIQKMKDIVRNAQQNSLLSDTKINAFIAEIALEEGSYEKAQKFLMRAFRKGERDLQIFSLMGNILLKLGDRQAALHCFEKINEISPQNIGRICQISDIYSNLGKTQESNRFLDIAKNMDVKNENVKSLLAKDQLNKGLLDEAIRTIATIHSLDPLIAMLNNQAIILSQDGKTRESIDIYTTTLKAVPVNKKDARSKITYNLALAFARENEILRALKVLDSKGMDHLPRDLERKADSLKKKLKYAAKNQTGVPLNLITHHKNKIAFAEERPIATDISPGEYGLHQIFESDSLNSEEVYALLAGPGRQARQNTA